MRMFPLPIVPLLIVPMVLALGGCATGTVESGGKLHPTVTYTYDGTPADLRVVTRDADGYCQGQGYGLAHLYRTHALDRHKVDAVFECIGPA